MGCLGSGGYVFDDFLSWMMIFKISGKSILSVRFSTSPGEKVKVILEEVVRITFVFLHDEEF